MEQNQQTQPPVFNQQQAPMPQYQPYPVARPMLGFGEANRLFWSKSLDFTGRARRSEFWWGYLSVFIISMIWSIIAAFIVAMMLKGATIDLNDDVEVFSWFIPKYLLAFSPMLLLMVPVYAAMTRRLHDTGRSGWWIVALLVCSLVYLVGVFYMMYNMIKASDYFALEIFDNPVVPILLFLFYIAALALGITIFVFTVLDSKPETNKYGPSPKYQ